MTTYLGQRCYLMEPDQGTVGQQATRGSRMRNSLSSLLLLPLIMAGCAGGIAKDPRYAPAESILDIATDFHRFSRENLYRFPIPKDVAGINIHKATLIRLEDYERKHPGRYTDIISYTKAMAYERLREYGKAMDTYRLAAAMSSPLAPEARARLEALRDFEQVIQGYGTAVTDPPAFVAHLEEKARVWWALSEKYRGTVYEYLALVEVERLDRLKVEYLQSNRHRLKGGEPLVIEAYQALIKTHEASRHRDEYLIDFADFYVVLAKEYVRANPPEDRTFQWEKFSQWANQAWRLYAEVAQKDGSLEKLEAQGKLQAIQAYVAKVRATSQ
ncbi:MAG: hypothetical protein ACE5I9_04325 [Candidatus Methylomirabilales bacterium]